MARRTAPANRSAPTAPPPAKLRLQELGVHLRDRLAAVLAHAGGNTLRPVSLAKAFRLDDSLAARLLRSIRASDPLSVLREAPSPQGLRLFVDAAARTGLSTAARDGAHAAIEAFESLLAELPLGRASLDTAIDGWLPSGRAKAERGARQAVYKALSQTLGFTIDTSCFALAIQPSAAGDTCDSMTFLAMDGIRRLREGSPILLLGHSWNTSRPSANGAEPLPELAIETLDGHRSFADAKSLLLPEFGDAANLPLRMIERENHSRILLDSSAPPLNVPVTVAAAFLSRHAYRRYRTPDHTTETFFNATKVPIRTFVQDLFLHEDVYPHFIPEVVTRMDSADYTGGARDREILEVERLDLDVELIRLGWGLDRIAIKEWGEYQPALASAFDRAGWDPRRFRAFRCTIRYPFPFISLTTWFDLPPAP